MSQCRAARFLVRGHRAGGRAPSRARRPRTGRRLHRRRRVHRGLRRPAPRGAGVLGHRAGDGPGGMGSKRTQRRAGRQRHARVDGCARTIARSGARRRALGAVRGGEGDHRRSHRPPPHSMRLEGGQPPRVHARALHGVDRARGGVLPPAFRLSRIPDAVPHGDARRGREHLLRGRADGRGRRTPAPPALRARDGGGRGTGRRPDLRRLPGRADSVGEPGAGVHRPRRRRCRVRRPRRQRLSRPPGAEDRVEDHADRQPRARDRAPRGTPRPLPSSAAAPACIRPGSWSTTIAARPTTGSCSAAARPTPIGRWRIRGHSCAGTCCGSSPSSRTSGSTTPGAAGSRSP